MGSDRQPAPHRPSQRHVMIPVISSSQDPSERPMNRDCQRWTELSDRRAVGQPLSDEDQGFLRDHVQRCDECQREEAALLGLITPPPADDMPSDQEVESLLRRVTETASRERRMSHRHWGGVAAGTLAVAAAVAFWISQPIAPPPSDGAGLVARNQTATDAVAPAARTAAPVPSPAQQDQAKPLAAESACAEVVSGIWACPATDTVITQRALDSKERTLELGRGRLVASLVPQPKGTSFSIVTAAGRVTAVGTVFSVESQDDGTTIARVLEGKVAVVTAGSTRPRFVRAGEALRLGDSRPSALSTEDRERDLALLSPELRAALARAAGSAPAATDATRSSSPESLLEEALALRGRGDFRGAAAVYRRIHQSSPGSPVGGTALVSLGELSLSSLGDPAGALAAFESYLVRGGALSQEAAFGKARALRALRRTAEERRAIEQFIARYPDAAQTKVLRQRLSALGP
jgi:ferric-dicitrate binding protein FerR (iron transport regulator)